MGKRERIYLWLHPHDRMKDLTVCRNCGKEVEYGKLLNHTGHDACHRCFEDLRRRILSTRENDYEQYRKQDHFYGIPRKEYKWRCRRLLDKRMELVTKPEMKYGSHPGTEETKKFLLRQEEKLERTD